MNLLIRQSLSFTKEVLIAGAITLLLLVVSRIGWTTVLTNGLQPALVPLAGGAASVVQVVEQPITRLNRSYARAEELVKLRNKYSEALAQLSELDKLRRENDQLRQMIENRHLSLTTRVVAAPVVSYAYPAVAAGSDQGVSVGGLITSSDTLLGRVTSVEPEQSRVELLSNKDAQPVLVQTETGLQGLVKGTGRGVILTQLPPESVVTKGERVVTFGQPGISPGIFVGVIAADQVQDTSPIKTVPVDQLVSFYSTPLVEIW